MGSGATQSSGGKEQRCWVQYLVPLSQHDGDAAPGMLGSMEETPRGTRGQALMLVAPHHCRRMVQMPQESSRDAGHKSTSSCFAGTQMISKALKGTCGQQTARRVPAVERSSFL